MKKYLLTYFLTILLFVFILESASGQIARPGKDCFDAVLLCTTESIKDTIQGCGPTPADCYGVEEASGVVCWSPTTEVYPYWYQFTAANDGVFQMGITPKFPFGLPNYLHDFRWAIFDITDGCASKTMISCNNSIDCGSTGISSDSLGVIRCLGTAATPRWNPDLNLQANHTYAIYIDYMFVLPGVSFTIDFNMSNLTNQVEFQNLDVSFTTSATSTCEGGSVTFTNTSVGPGNTTALYTWDLGDGTIFDTTFTSITHTYANPGSYWVYLSAKAGKCNGKDSMLVTINSNPDVTLAADIAICGAGTVQLTSTVTGGSPGYTYSWSPSSGLSNPSNPNPTATVSTTTTYILTVTDTKGCSDKDTITIIVNPIPVITTSKTDATCGLSDGTATADAGAGSYTYNWNSAPPQFTATATGLPAGTYTVTVTDASTGCFDTAQVTIINSNPPIANAGTAVTICNGSSTTLNGSATGGVPSYAFSWSPTASLSDPNIFNPVASPTTTTIYTLTVTDFNGCQATSQVTVSVNPLPTITVNAVSNTICSGTSTIVNASGASTYTWSPATGLSATTGASVTATPTVTTTYTVTGIDANGCINTNTITITVNPLPTVTINPPTGAICVGETVTLTASGATTYTWSPATGLNTTNGPVVNASPTETTTYTVTGSNGTCTNTANVTVTVTPLPVVVVTPASATICNGSSTTLTASGATTYTWSPATGLSATNTATVTASPAVTTTYTVTGVGAGGCQNTTMVTVTVNPLPTITITPSSSSICVGGSTTLTASGASNYVWSPATGLSATNTAVVNANPATTTTYTVTGTDANGCQNTTTVTITVNPLPTITVTPSSANVCRGTPTVLTASGANTYTWSPATGLSGTSGPTVTATPTVTTTYTVTGTDVNGCISTKTVTITVRTLPTITVTPANPIICRGTSTVLTASGAASFTWSPATGLSGTSGASVTASPTVTTTYTVTGTAANGCTNTRTVTVTVRDLPTVTITPPSSVICQGNSVSLTASGATNYTWSPATGLSGTSGATVTATPTVTTTYTVTGTDANGCINTATATITVNPKPVLTTSSTDALCGANDGTATVNHGAGTYTYSWNTSPIQLTQTATGLSAGTYTVLVTNTTTSCFDTVSATVLNPTGPTVSAGLNDTICLGNSITLNGSITDGEPPYIFGWTPAATLINANTLTPTATPTATTTYTLTATDDNNCTTTDQVTIVVNNPEAITSTDDTICLGESTTLIASGGNIYSWTPSTGLNNTNNDTVIATPTTTTIYYVTVQDNIGCTDKDSIKVTVLPIPNISINTSDDELCLGDSTTLTASGAVSYTWSPSTGLNTTVGNTVIANPTTDITYYVTGIGANGCSSTDSILITVNPIPDILVDIEDSVFCNGSSTTLTASGGVNYTWSPSTGLSSTTAAVVTATPNSDITYTVIGEDANGCTNTATASVTVNQLPPISITPVSAEICLGSATEVSASGANTYIWSPTTALSPTTGPVVTANPITTTIYQVIGTDINGCSDTAFVTVTVNPLPNVAVTTTDSVICVGENTTLNATGALNYTWTPTSSLSSSTGPTVTAEPTVTTNYIVSGTDVNGCINADTVRIRVIPQPLITITPTNDSICLGNSIQLTANGANSYVWSPGGTLSSTSGTTVTATPTTTITYFVTGTDNNGCIGDTSILVTVMPLPILALTPNNPIICIGETVELIASGANTYQWSPTTFLNPTTGSVVNSTPTNDITYTVVGFDLFGCSDTLTASIQVNQLPNIEIHATDSVLCKGDTVNLIATGGINYVWTPNVAISTTNGNSVDVFPSTTIVYTVNGTDANSCSNKDSITITVNPLPFVDFDGLVTPICMNSSPVTLTGNPTGGTFTGNGISGNIFTPAIAGLGGPYSITYTFNDANGCKNDTTKNVTVNSVPVATVNGLLADYCQNFGVVILEGAPIGGTFTVDGVVTTFFNTNDLSLGNHSVVYSFTDGNGCSDDTTMQFAINPIPTVSFSGLSNSYCFDANNSTLTGSPSGGTFSGNGIVGNIFNPSLAGVGTHTITYSFTDGNGCANTSTQNVIINALPIVSYTGLDTLYCINATDDLLTGLPIGGVFTGSGIVANTFSPTTAGVGNYTITYTFNDANGCTNSFTRVTRVVGLPNISASNIQDVSCYGDVNGSVQLNGSAGMPTYTYSIDGTTFTVINTFTNLLAGNYTGYVTDANGCINNTTFNINEPDSISAVFNTINPLNCTDSTGAIIISNITGGTPNYLTNLNNGAFTTTLTYTNLSSGNHIVIIKDDNGCEKSYTTSITSPTSIVASDSSTNIRCFGENNGMVMVYNISGSVKPYEFSLDNITYGSDSIFSGLAPGFYTIFIKGADGCLSQYNFNITEPTELQLTLPSKNNILCFGETTGNIIANATGGVPAYSFVLNGGTPQVNGIYNNLSAGNYTLVVTDANGCNKQLNFVITEPDSISASFSTVDPLICSVNDGVINIFDITGGVRPFTFAIDFGTPQTDSTFNNLFSGNHIITITDNNGCTKNLSIDLTSPSDILATVTSTNVLCFGNTNGTITVSGVTGGESPYTYSLNNTNYFANPVFTGLPAGNYTVYIRDADLCITTYTVSITEPTELLASVSDFANITCFGDNNGTATILVTGGTPGYMFSTDGFNYNFNNVFTNMVENNYLVFVKDTNNCLTFTSFAIVEPAELIADINLINEPDCKNPTSGSVEFINVSGGTAPLRYSDGVNVQSSPLFENLVAGIYTFTVTDTNGCFLQFPITITNKDTISVDIATTSNLCATENIGTVTATVIAGGVAPFEFSIDGINFQTSGTFTGLAGGNYVMFIKDADTCIFSKTFEIYQPDTLKAQIIVDNPIICFGASNATISVVPSGGTPLYTYSLDGVNFVSDSIFINVPAGNDTLYVVDNNGCQLQFPYEIVQPDTFRFELEVGSLLCFGDTDADITINAEGGTPNYTYSIDGTNFQTNNVFTNVGLFSGVVSVLDNNGCRIDSAITITAPDSLHADVSVLLLPSCVDGTKGEIELINISGGTNPIKFSIDGTNYQYSTTFNNLDGGTYTVTMLDTNGCIKTFTAILPTSDTLDLDISTSDNLCATNTIGSITVTIHTSVNPPYQYSLNNTTSFQTDSIFNGLTGGSYTVYIKDENDCLFSYPVTISQPDTLKSELNITNDIKCFGENSATVILVTSGGTPSYTYSLDGFTYGTDSIFANLGGGLDSVYVQDANGCIITLPFEIIQPDTFKVNISVGNLVCFNDSNLTFTINATGGTPVYQYSIDGVNFQLDSIFAGINQYNDIIVVVDANGCRFDSIFVITRPDTIKGDIINSSVANCTAFTGEITLANIVGGTFPYTISIDGGAFGTDTVFANLSAGTHIISIQDANGCISNLIGEVGQFGGLFEADLVIVPNLCPRENVAQIRFTNIEGQSPPFSFSLNGTTFQLDSNFINLSAGVYYPQVVDDNGCLFRFDTIIFESIDTILTEVIHLENTLPRDSIGEFTIGNTIGATPFNDNGTFFYMYSLGSLDTDSFSVNSAYTDLKEGIYTVYIKDSRGCIDSIAVSIGRVIITPPMLIPNIFTPNGDDINDYFVITMLPPNSKLNIVNRWGNRVYRTDNYQNDWDGGKQDDGIYYYYLELENGLIYKGWVEISTKIK